jgi:hypothetical protein
LTESSVIGKTHQDNNASKNVKTGAKIKIIKLALDGKTVVTMEARRLVRASGSRMMTMYIKLQVTIEAHFPTAVNRVMEVPLQLGNEPGTCNLTPNFLAIP